MIKKVLILLAILPSVAFAADPEVLSAGCQPADFKLVAKAIQIAGEAKVKALYPNADTIRINPRFRLNKDLTTQAIQLTNVLPADLLEFAAPSAAPTVAPTPAPAAAVTPGPTAVPTVAPTAPSEELRLASGAVLPVPQDICESTVGARIKLRYKISGVRVKKEWNGEVKFRGTVKLAKGAK